jgi:DNA-binding response OmpR family regulator
MRILIIEDDRKVASFLQRGLREEGYAADAVHDGAQGLTAAHVHDYDLLIVDLMLPGRNGYDIVRELRAAGKNVPILMLTARDSPEDLVMGLDAGADDYVTKPFSLSELHARVRALLRRGGAGRTERLLYDDVEMDRIRHVAKRAGTDLILTPREFQLLEYFMLHPEKVVRRTELLEKVWEMSFDPQTNVVDVHVGNLRRKLIGHGGDQLIHTVRGVGYVLSRDAPP